MNELPTSYLYFDRGYEFMSLHRKALKYDPRATNNPIIDDYFETYKRTNNGMPIYYKVLERELFNLRSMEVDAVPISFKMLLQEINMAWVNIIHQMLFKPGGINWHITAKCYFF